MKKRRRGKVIINGTRVKIKTSPRNAKPILWDDVFEGVKGVITSNNGEGDQYTVQFDYSLKHNRPDWSFGRFWESEFEVLIPA